jgi:hypothetical protein
MKKNKTKKIKEKRKEHNLTTAKFFNSYIKFI